MTKSIALCADDYAQHPGIDQAVCALLALGRLSAVSCLSEAPRWASHGAPRLREFDGADVGLHLNLTERFGPPQASLAALIAASYLRRLDTGALRQRLERQFDAFEAGLGRAPDFVDGHQHVHQLPQVRELVLDLLAQRYGARLPWVRNTVPAPGTTGAKPALLRLLGGAALAVRLRQAGIGSNRGFGGVYGFAGDDYAARFAHWLARAGQAGLLMCHPGATLDAFDPISAQRLVEYRFLCSDAFPALLAAHHTRLASMTSMLPA
ncbi:MAG: ChbG/HpnK family deacetylase [Pseudomonadota bacterium]